MDDRERDLRTVQIHHRLLGVRITLHARVRLAMAALIVFGALFAHSVLGIRSIDVAALLWLAVAVCLYNTAAFVVIGRLRRMPGGARRLRVTMHLLITLDFLALTVGVWLVGGARSPFLAFYLLHVILSCLLLERRDGVAIGVLAYALIVGLVLGEWLGIAPPRLPIGAVAGVAPLDWRYAVTLLVVYGVLIAVTVFLVASLSARLRAEEQTLLSENLELDRQSSLRRDFLHLALHDIQAMVGIVSANLKNMAAGLGGPLAEKHEAWVGTCLRQLEKVDQFLKEFRILETLASESLDAKRRPVDLSSLLEELVASHREQAEGRGHVLGLDVPPGLPPVQAIPELLREAVANYLTNAIKYTPDGGRIVVRASRRDGFVRVEVEDNGIGIAPEDVPKLFTEFVRLDHSGTPVADARGTGLGLSIVRRVLERLGGATGVHSEPGTGSTFYLEVPVSVKERLTVDG